MYVEIRRIREIFCKRALSILQKISVSCKCCDGVYMYIYIYTYITHIYIYRMGAFWYVFGRLLNGFLGGGGRWL